MEAEEPLYERAFWEECSDKFPVGSDETATSQRQALFDAWDASGNGLLSMQEVDSGVLLTLGMRCKACKPAILRAFQASKSKADDAVSPNEFKLLLRYLRRYFGFLAMFEEIDGGRHGDKDKRISLEEFKASRAQVEAWASSGPRPRARILEQEFIRIHRAMTGSVTFEEFSEWAFRRKLAFEEDEDADLTLRAPTKSQLNDELTAAERAEQLRATRLTRSTTQAAVDATELTLKSLASSTKRDAAAREAAQRAADAYKQQAERLERRRRARLCMQQQRLELEAQRKWEKEEPIREAAVRASRLAALTTDAAAAGIDLDTLISLRLMKMGRADEIALSERARLDADASSKNEWHKELSSQLLTAREHERMVPGELPPVERAAPPSPRVRVSTPGRPDIAAANTASCLAAPVSRSVSCTVRSRPVSRTGSELQSVRSVSQSRIASGAKSSYKRHVLHSMSLTRMSNNRVMKATLASGTPGSLAGPTIRMGSWPQLPLYESERLVAMLDRGQLQRAIWPSTVPSPQQAVGLVADLSRSTRLMASSSSRLHTASSATRPVSSVRSSRGGTDAADCRPHTSGGGSSMNNSSSIGFANGPPVLHKDLNAAIAEREVEHEAELLPKMAPYGSPRHRRSGGFAKSL